MPVICVPPPYRGPTRGQAELEVEGRTVGECIAAAEARYPGFAELMLDGAGRLHRFVRIFVEEQPIATDGLASPVAEDARLDVIAAIGGG